MTNKKYTMSPYTEVAMWRILCAMRVLALLTAECMDLTSAVKRNL